MKLFLLGVLPSSNKSIPFLFEEEEILARSFSVLLIYLEEINPRMSCCTDVKSSFLSKA